MPGYLNYSIRRIDRLRQRASTSERHIKSPGGYTSTTQQGGTGPMLALVTSSDSATGLKLAEFGEPQPAPDEALISLRATSVNRGELRLLAMRPNGWRPGQDVAGVVERAAADGSGPAVGARV